MRQVVTSKAGVVGGRGYIRGICTARMGMGRVMVYVCMLCGSTRSGSVVGLWERELRWMVADQADWSKNRRLVQVVQG